MSKSMQILEILHTMHGYLSKVKTGVLTLDGKSHLFVFISAERAKLCTAVIQREIIQDED